MKRYKLLHKGIIGKDHPTYGRVPITKGKTLNELFKIAV